MPKALVSLQPTSKIWINRDAPIHSIICLATGHDVKQVVITGVSTGIGYACVKLLLSREFRVYDSVRNQTDADRLHRDFGQRFVPLLFDVTDEKTVQAEAAKVTAEVIAEVVCRALTSSRPKVRYAVVPHRLKNWIIPQLIPMRTLDRLVARFMGIRRRK